MKIYDRLLKERSEIRLQRSQINDCVFIFEKYDKNPYEEEFWLAINLVLNQLEEKEEEINKEIEDWLNKKPTP